MTERASDVRELRTVRAQASSMIRGVQLACSYLSAKASLLPRRRVAQTPLPSKIRGRGAPPPTRSRGLQVLLGSFSGEGAASSWATLTPGSLPCAQGGRVGWSPGPSILPAQR